MPEILIYQTSDPAFADRILEELQSAGIAGCRVGEGVRKLSAPGRRMIASQVSVFITREADYPRANSILLAFGAVVERRRRSLPGWVWLLITAVITAALTWAFWN